MSRRVSAAAVGELTWDLHIIPRTLFRAWFKTDLIEVDTLGARV